MELHAVRVLEAERLVLVRARTSERHRALGQLEGVAVPLQRRERLRQRPEDGVAPSLVRQLHRQHTDLRPLPGVDARAEARGEELHAEADAPEREAGAYGVGHELLLVAQPRQLALVVHAHRAAHGDDAVEAPPVG